MARVALRLDLDTITPRAFFALCDEHRRILEIERVNLAVEIANCSAGGKPGITIQKRAVARNDERAFGALL